MTALSSSINTGNIGLITSDATGTLLYQWSPGWLQSASVSVCLVHSDGTCGGGADLTADYPDIGADDPQGQYHYSGSYDYQSGSYLGTNGYKFSTSGGGISAELTPGSPFQGVGDALGFDLSGKFCYSDNGNVYKVTPSDGTLIYSGPSNNLYSTGDTPAIQTADSYTP